MNSNQQTQRQESDRQADKKWYSPIFSRPEVGPLGVMLILFAMLGYFSIPQGEWSLNPFSGLSSWGGFSGSSGEAIIPQASNVSADIPSNQLYDEENNSGSYGFFYPDAGFIVLNPSAIGATLKGNGSPTLLSNMVPNPTINANGFNSQKLLNSISYGANFILDSEEKVTSQYYFTRVKNSEFNYTTNPSFIDSQGNLRFDSMTDQPVVYITTVGLYSDTGDLLGVAKLSKPLAKDFTKESLIKVKIDY